MTTHNIVTEDIVLAVGVVAAVLIVVAIPLLWYSPADPAPQQEPSTLFYAADDPDTGLLEVGGEEVLLHEHQAPMLVTGDEELVRAVETDGRIDYTFVIHGVKLVTWDADGEVIWVSDDLCRQLCSTCTDKGVVGL